MEDLKLSDSLLVQLSAQYQQKEVGPIFSLIGHALLQHQFTVADSLLRVAKTMGLKKYELAASSFDVDFELGRMVEASAHLQNMQLASDFGYQFRKSKLMHYQGELDSSIVAMEKAVENAAHDQSLKLSALSNLGDLYMHAGKMDQAYQCFKNCLSENAGDFHSILGIGWIALVHDQQDSLAEKAFQFVGQQTASPDYLFKLIAVAEQRSDSLMQLKQARAFEQIVSQPKYGHMYNKYLIQLYTGILHDPKKAVSIALHELKNRNTPQTKAWYVWSLVCDQQIDQANLVYQNSVAGKPLEALELYWMGKFMQQQNKGYNAKQYFKEAQKNKFDLSPAIIKDLDSLLKE
jgi:tetratricopeptide (TPR) repeat protein